MHSPSVQHRGNAAARNPAGLQRAAQPARRRGADAARLAPGPHRVPGGYADGEGGMRLLVCGGAGFIGSTFVRLRVLEHGDQVTVLDKLTYAGRRENLQDVASE